VHPASKSTRSPAYAILLHSVMFVLMSNGDDQALEMVRPRAIFNRLDRLVRRSVH